MEEIKTDYCIIGAGIAGIILASKLVASGKSILLLDQGPQFSEEDRAIMLLKSKDSLNDFVDYNDDVNPITITPHTSAENDNLVVKYSNNRLFGFGGTALHIQGVMMRPIEDDLKTKSLYGYGRDWPISYRKLEPWLLKSEYEVGVAGNEDNPYASPRSGSFPMPAHSFSYFDREIFGPALKKLGIEGHSCPYSINTQSFNGRSKCLACRACKFCPSGARYSPDRVHLPYLDQQENVSKLENISVRKLNLNSKGDKVVSAQVFNLKDKSESNITAQRFIIAIGGVETPRLLLLSADNNAHKYGLGNSGGQLGKGFSDHAKLSVLYKLSQHVGSRLGFETMFSDHFRANINRIKNPTFLFTASPTSDWYDIGSATTQWSINNNTLSLKNLRKEIPQCASLWTMMELEGKGILELDDKKVDAFGSPLAKINMKITKRDKQGHSFVSEVISQIGHAMKAEHISEISPIGFGKTGNHPSGATAMANNPEEGVCDKNLSVFGLYNLYLLSSSVFPHMGANPPTLTIVALALRLAKHLEKNSIKI